MHLGFAQKCPLVNFDGCTMQKLRRVEQTLNETFCGIKSALYLIVNVFWALTHIQPLFTASVYDNIKITEITFSCTVYIYYLCIIFIYLYDFVHLYFFPLQMQLVRYDEWWHLVCLSFTPTSVFFPLFFFFLILCYSFFS